MGGGLTIIALFQGHRGIRHFGNSERWKPSLVWYGPGGLPACRRLLFPLLHAEKGRLRNAVANRVPASRWQGIRLLYIIIAFFRAF